MNQSFRLPTAVLGAALLSMSLTAASMNQSNAQAQQPSTQGQTQQMQQPDQMQRQGQVQRQGQMQRDQAEPKRAASGASQREGRLHAPLPLPEPQTVALLNTLSAEGYLPRGGFERAGNVWQMPAVNSRGEPTTIVLDRAAGQVMSREASGRTAVVASIPASQTGTMSGSPERTQRRR